MTRRGAAVGLVAYLVAVGALTLGPLPRRLLLSVRDVVREVAGLDVLSTGAVERPANILLFVPIGTLLCYALPTVARWHVLVLCILASASVELTQLVLPDREPSLRDVVLNGTGAALGVLVHLVLTRHRSRLAPGRE